MKEILNVNLPNFKASCDVEWFETDDFSEVEEFLGYYPWVKLASPKILNVWFGGVIFCCIFYVNILFFI